MRWAGIKNPMKSTFTVVLIALLLVACSEKSTDRILKIELTEGLPGKEKAMRWSPKGEKLILEETEDGYKAELFLGTRDLDPVNLLLYSSVKDEQPDRLAIDMNRNGLFNEEADTILSCEPTERRGKVWSSFSGIIPVPFKGNQDLKAVVNSYPLSFWYVYDPLEPEADKILRYSRRGWMEGSIDTGDGTIHILLAESKMDGVFDRDDYWSIAPDSALHELFAIKSSRPADTHAWFGEQAYGIDSLLPSGRAVWIKKVDPQITRAEEEKANDWLAPDRAAKRSGNKVAFLHDLDYAMRLAEERKQNVLIDFETTWCGPCKTMDKWVYTADAVITASKNTVCVKVDGDENRKLVKEYEIAAYPTMLLLSHEGDILKRVTGYQSVLKMVDFLK